MTEPTNKVVEIDVPGMQGPAPFSYASRAAFLAAAEAPADGVLASAGGVTYLRKASATLIPDLHGWVPAGDVQIEHFGGIADGTTDVSAAANAAAAAGVAELHLMAGTYRVRSKIDRRGMSIRGAGVGSTIIDGTDPAFTGDCLLSTEGTLVAALGALSQNAVRGQDFIKLSNVSDLAVGTVLQLYNPTDYSWLNYVGVRPYYRAGEFVQITEIDAGTGTCRLNAALYDSYLAGSVTVQILNGYSPRISDLTLIGNGTANTTLGTEWTPLRVRYCRDVLISNVRVIHNGRSAISVDRCFGFVVDAVDSSDTGPTTNATQYGIEILNSQHGVVSNSILFGTRHALATGGGTPGVPVRDLRVSNCILSNRRDPADAYQCCNLHGNSEDIRFSGCKIYGGATFAGANVRYEDCDVTAGPTGRILEFTELKGGLHRFSGGTLTSYVDPAPGTHALVDCGMNHDNAFDTFSDRDFVVEIDNTNIIGRNLSAGTNFAGMWNRGSKAKMTVTIRDCSFDVDYLGCVLRTSLLNVVDRGSEAHSDGFVVDRLRNLPRGTELVHHNVADYAAFPHKLQRQSGIWSSVSTAAAANDQRLLAFANPYPKAPKFMAFARGANGTIGGKAVIATCKTLTGGAYQIGIATVDGGNMTAADPFEVHWTAEIDEVAAPPVNNAIQIAFGSAIQIPDWNVTGQASPGTVTANLLTGSGADTNITLRITDGGASDQTNSALVPASGSPFNAASILHALTDGNDNIAFELSGLDNARDYRLQVTGCRTSADSRVCDVSVVGATTPAAQTYEAVGNNGAVWADFTLKPAANKLTITIARHAGNVVGTVLSAAILTPL